MIQEKYLLQFTRLPITSGKLLPNTNRNLTPAQQIIYIYGPRQWRMQNGNNLVDIAGNGYLITSGMGAHKLHVRKLPWYKARRICIQEGGEFLTAILLNDDSSRSLRHVSTILREQ